LPDAIGSVTASSGFIHPVDFRVDAAVWAFRLDVCAEWGVAASSWK
jgi:hypothetical protein